MLAVILVAAVGLAIAVLPPLVALWLVFGAALVAIVLAIPIAGLYLLPFAVAFGSLVSFTVHGSNVGPTDLIVVALVIACAWQWKSAPGAWWIGIASGMPTTGNTASTHALGVRDISRALLDHTRSAWRRNALSALLGVALLGYLAIVVISLAVATDRASTLKEIAKWSEVALVVACGAYLLTTLSRVHRLVWAILAAGMLEALLGLEQWVLTYGARVYGTFDQPNPFAGFLNFALPLALALVLFAPDINERWMAAAMTVLLAGGEYAAHSRGATLGIAAALVVIVVVGWRRERVAALISGFGAGLAAVAWVLHAIPLRLQQQMLNEVNLSDSGLCNHVNNADFSTMERLAHWAAGLRMFAAHPLLGVGAGNFEAAYFGYNTWCWELPLGHAHNYYINAAAETGVLGLAAFLALTGLSWALGWHATHMRGQPLAGSASGALRAGDGATAPATVHDSQLARALALGVFGVVVALAVHNLTDDLFVHAMELEFALCLAMLLRLGVPSQHAT